MSKVMTAFRLSVPGRRLLAAWAAHRQTSQADFLEHLISRVPAPTETTPSAKAVREAKAAFEEQVELRKRLNALETP